MKEGGRSEGMVESLMDMALFCDRALRAREDEESSPLDTDVSGNSTVPVYTLIAGFCV